MLLGVDVGGTFTDAVLAFDGRLVTAKAPSTPHDQSEGVIAAIEAALERAGRSPEDIDEFSHGMTVVTNALLEGRAARTESRGAHQRRDFPSLDPAFDGRHLTTHGRQPRLERWS